MRFLNLEGKPERESPKTTMSASGGHGLLQMVLEPGSRRYVSEDVGPPRGVDCEIPHWLESQVPGGVSVRTLSPQGGWIVRSNIGWRGEQNIPYKG